MHVCLATPEYAPTFNGGIATYFGHLAGILHQQGHRVTVLTSVAADDTSDDSVGPRIVRIEKDVRRRLAALRPAFGPEVNAVARSAAIGLAMRDWLLANADAAGVDVVEAPEYGGSAAFLVAEHLPPLVVTCHGSTGQVQTHTSSAEREIHHDFLASLELSAAATADAVACYGHGNRAAWEDYLGRRVHYVVPPFLPTPADTTAGSPRRGLLGIAIGRLNNWKGVLETLEALALCDARGVDVSIRWVGRDQSAPADGLDSVRDHIEATYPRLWGRRFLWEHELSPPAVRAAQAAADFAVVPSRWDTFNFTAPEAMSMGTPLVISSGAGASDLCKDGENALVVPPRDPEALADALSRLTDASLRRRLGEAGRATVQRELAPERVTESRLEVYSEAADRHRKRANLGHARSLMNPFAWQWMRVAELASPPAVTARLPSRLVVREALRRLSRQGPRWVVARLPWK